MFRFCCLAKIFNKVIYKLLFLWELILLDYCLTIAYIWLSTRCVVRKSEIPDTLKHDTFIHNFLLKKFEEGMSAIDNQLGSWNKS